MSLYEMTFTIKFTQFGSTEEEAIAEATKYVREETQFFVEPQDLALTEAKMLYPNIGEVK